ncbi:MAG: peptidoglycan-binding protein [Clostridia bacterium]|nr:peptidoglycan-binding protein [Clostridia bacterium]
MKTNQQRESRLHVAAHGGISLLLAFCLLLSLWPAASVAAVTAAQLDAKGASYGGDGPAKISPSAVKVYVQLSNSTNVFTTDISSPGKTVGAGAVLQLVANKYYTIGADHYFCLYYENTAWNVLADDVYQNIKDDAWLTGYITNTLWQAGSYSSINKDLGLRGDVRVHGLQMALSRLGYYTGALDGNFGSGTESAIRNFQRSDKKLDVDGRAGPATQAALYPLALNSNNPINNNTNTNSGNASNIGTLRTTASVNLRQRATTSSPRLAIVPRNLTLNYFGTTSVGGITWYNVIYGSQTGWLMGSFVSASGGGSGGGSSGGGGGGVQIGTVTITLPGTRVRQSPNGSKTGVVLAKGSTVPLMGQPVSAAGYQWYPVQTSGGVYGYVRGDCCKANFSGGGGGGGGIAPSSNKTYITTGGVLSVFTAKEKPASGFVNIPAGQVIQLLSTTTYTENGVVYCSLYYNNMIYNAVYADIQQSWIMTDAQLTSYLTGTIWNSGYTASLKQEMNLVGDVRVHAAQLALSVLGFYTGSLDGNFGPGTESAVRNFQRKNNLTVDGSVGPKTWPALFSAAVKAYSGGSGSGGSGSGGATSGFGVVNSVEKATWDGDGLKYFPKYTYATVMDVSTKYVFTVYRWEGSNHVDCFPATANDTKTMCDIVGFPYPSRHPTDAEKTKILNDAVNNHANYTWPDFKGTLTGVASIGNKWDRRPALLNVGGRVFCVSIYGWPHGYSNSADMKAYMQAGYYKNNNYYGVMCIWFPGSENHTKPTLQATKDQHNAAINTAYTEAKKIFPSATFK